MVKCFDDQNKVQWLKVNEMNEGEGETYGDPAETLRWLLTWEKYAFMLLTFQYIKENL